MVAFPSDYAQVYDIIAFATGQFWAFKVMRGNTRLKLFCAHVVHVVHSCCSFDWLSRSSFSALKPLRSRPVCREAGGGMVYAGPVAEVKPYFVSCGFPFPEEWRIMWLTEDVR